MNGEVKGLYRLSEGADTWAVMMDATVVSGDESGVGQPGGLVDPGVDAFANMLPRPC